jgi:hypothetical protein
MAMTDTKLIQPLGTAADVLLTPEEAARRIESRRKSVAVFLQTLLGGGPRRVSEVEARARADGLLGARQTISQSKIFKQVKTELGIKSMREGFGSRGVWSWVLPQPASETTRSPDEIERSGRPVPTPGLVLLRVEPVVKPGSVLSRADSMAMPEEFRGLDAVPLEWRRGVAHLGRPAAPRDVPANRWHQFAFDCHRFIVGDWAERAAKAGWTALALFGCNPVNPLGHLQLAGLLWIVEGGRIMRLRADGADIETATGAQRTHAPRHRGSPSKIRDLLP